jgi:hypothetical protein
MEHQVQGRMPWAALTGLVGLAALAITISFSLLPAVTAAGGCVAGNTLMEFEFARTLGELQQVLHAPGDACRAPTLAAMDQSNTLDVFVFIPTYTAFTILAALFLGDGRLRRPLVMAAIAASAVALVADYVETTRLLAITKDVEANAGLAPVASLAAWIKFGALAVNALLLAGLCFTTEPRRRILGALCVLPIIGFGLALASPALHGMMTLGFVASWLPLTLVALWTAFRPGRAAAAPAAA